MHKHGALQRGYRQDSAYVRLHRVTLRQAKENETFPYYLHLPLGTGSAKILYTNMLSVSLSLSLS